MPNSSRKKIVSSHSSPPTLRLQHTFQFQDTAGSNPTCFHSRKSRRKRMTSKRQEGKRKRDDRCCTKLGAAAEVKLLFSLLFFDPLQFPNWFTAHCPHPSILHRMTSHPPELLRTSWRLSTDRPNAASTHDLVWLRPIELLVSRAEIRRLGPFIWVRKRRHTRGGFTMLVLWSNTFSTAGCKYCSYTCISN